MSIRRISDLPNYSILSGNQEDNLTQWLLTDNNTSVSLSASLIEISEMSTGNGTNVHMYKSKNMTMMDLYNVMTDNILYKDTIFNGNKTFLDDTANFKVDVNSIQLTAKNNLKLKIDNSNISSNDAFSLEVPDYVSSYTQTDENFNKFHINAEHLNLSSNNHIWIRNIDPDGLGNENNSICLRTNNLNLSGSNNINLSGNNINLTATNNIQLTSSQQVIVQSGTGLILDVNTQNFNSNNKLELKSKNIHFGDKQNNSQHLDFKENENDFILKTPACYIGFAKSTDTAIPHSTYGNLIPTSILSNINASSGSYLQMAACGDIDMIAPGVDIYIKSPNSDTGTGFGIYEVNDTGTPTTLFKTIVSDTDQTTHFQFFTDISGTAMRARWADLAETYASDKMYKPGTLMQFGGSEEVTIATTEVNAVVSTKPAFLMNADISSENKLPLALIGRVPVRVIGSIKKFERIILSDIPGVACNRKFANQQAIGVALESSDDEGEKLILCSVKLQL